MRRGLRGQLALAIAGVGGLAIVLNLLLLGLVLQHYFADQESAAITAQAHALATCCRSPAVPVVVLEHATLARVIDEVLVGTPQRRALVAGPQGRPIFASSFPPAVKRALLARLRQAIAAAAVHGPGPVQQFTLDGWLVAEQTLRVRRLPNPMITAGADTRGMPTVTGGLLLAENTSVISDRLRQVVILLALTGAAAVAFAAVGGLAAAAAIARPLRALTGAARAVAAGRLHEQVRPDGPAEVKELAQAFNEMAGEVLRRQRIERDLVANVSHELAGPLQVIRGYAEALADRVVVQPEQRAAALQAIAGEATRLTRICADLLDLTLLETGQVTISPENVPVQELLAGLVERFNPAARQAGVTLTSEAPADLPPVCTDGLRLEALLVNLITNALRHTPPRGQITLAANLEEATVAITVADTGGGIAPEDLPHIWERFYRGDKGRGRRAGGAGVGLGLAIARSSVTLLNGTIEAASQAGHGARFTVRLPLQQN
jgi:signal transduction histidine kinase